MCGEITIHNSATGYNGQEFKTKVNQNIRITGERIDTSVNNGRVSNRGNNRTMELTSHKYELMEYIAGLDGDKGTLTEADFIKFKERYANDKDFQNKINKQYDVTGVRQDANAGITTIDFKSIDLDYNTVKSSMRVDFETSAEKAQREAKEKAAKEKPQTQTQAQPQKPSSQAKEKSIIDKIIDFFK